MLSPKKKELKNFYSAHGSQVSAALPSVAASALDYCSAKHYNDIFAGPYQCAQARLIQSNCTHTWVPKVPTLELTAAVTKHLMCSNG